VEDFPYPLYPYLNLNPNPYVDLNLNPYVNLYL
jgi:hypothetical protein